MRTFLAILAVTTLVGLAATTAATAAPTKNAKLSPAETTWVTPVLKLWNNLNVGLQNVVAQATAKEALLVGSRNNLKLNGTLAVFITCTKTLKKAGAAPARLAKFSVAMKRACTPLEAGSHDFAKAIGAIRKGNSILGQKKLIQGVGEFKQGSARLAVARKRLLAVSGSNTGK